MNGEHYLFVYLIITLQVISMSNNENLNGVLGRIKKPLIEYLYNFQVFNCVWGL